MPHPSDIIYDLTLEKINGIRPVRIYIRFKHGSRFILAIRDPITGKRVPLDYNVFSEDGQSYDQLEEAIQLFKWVVKNDPDPIAPAIVKFIESI